MARQGFNKEGDGPDTFKLVTFYSADSRLPVSFEMQPGNIPDVSTVFNSIRRAQSYGLRKPQFVLDNGFFSKADVSLLCRSHVKFTMRATLSDKWICRRFDGDGKADIPSLRAGLAAMTADRIQAWFDCIETVTVRNSRGRARWTTECIRRDKLFQKMLAEL